MQFCFGFIQSCQHKTATFDQQTKSTTLFWSRNKGRKCRVYSQRRKNSRKYQGQPAKPSVLLPGQRSLFCRTQYVGWRLWRAPRHRSHSGKNYRFSQAPDFICDSRVGVGITTEELFWRNSNNVGPSYVWWGTRCTRWPRTRSWPS